MSTPVDPGLKTRPPAPSTSLMRQMADVWQRVADTYALDISPTAQRDAEAHRIMARTIIAAADYIDAVKAEEAAAAVVAAEIPRVVHPPYGRDGGFEARPA